MVEHSATVRLGRIPQNVASVTLTINPTGNGKFALAQDSKISVETIDRSSSDSTPEIWESVALSGIFWALRKAGLNGLEMQKIDVSVLRISGTLHAKEKTGVAIAAGLATLKHFGTIEVSQSELQGWAT